MGRKKLTEDDKYRISQRNNAISRINASVSKIPEFNYESEIDAFIHLVVCNLFSKSEIENLTEEELQILDNFCEYYVPIIDWKLCKIRELQGMLEKMKSSLSNLGGSTCPCHVRY